MKTNPMKANPMKTVEDLCKVLKAVGNKNRLRILTQLTIGEMSVGQIETALKIKQPNLSHELKKLRDLGLVSTRRDSKVIHYQLASSQVATLIDGLTHLASMTTDSDSIAIHSIPSTKQTQRLAARPGHPRSLTSMSRDGEYGHFPVIQN